MDFMQEHTLDAAKSREVYHACKQKMAQKQCYINIFHAAMHFSEKLVSGEWRVAYGYYSVSGFPKLLARHCFFLAEDGKVIDPTLFTRWDIDWNPDYFIMKVFDSYRDYLHAVNKADGYPDLQDTLLPLERQAFAWAAERGYALCG